MNSFHVWAPLIVTIALFIGFVCMLYMHRQTQAKVMETKGIILRLEGQVEEIDSRTSRNIEVIHRLQEAIQRNGATAKHE